MKTYKLKSARVMGDEAHPTYGYTYWAYAHDSDMPLMFSSKQAVPDVDGLTIEAETTEVKEGKKGDYLRLKGVKINSGAGENQASPSPTLNEPREQNPKAAAGSDKYLKDLSDYPLRVFTSGLAYMDTPSLMKGGQYLEDYLAFVGSVSAELASMSEKLRLMGSRGLKQPQEEPESGYEHAKTTAKRFKQAAVAPNEEGYEEDIGNIFDED